MFGVLQSCRSHFTQSERQEWKAHICGLCLALRSDHGQIARLTTNYDAALISVLYEAQADAPAERRVHWCALRPEIRGRVVPADQVGARYAATVSALSGAAKISDHIADGEGWARYVPALAGGLAGRWAAQARHSAGQLGFDSERIEAHARGQAQLERQDARDFGFFARPTELAVGAAFGHTAVLAQVPGNVAALELMGQMYGRIMYLLDSYRDYAADTAAGAFNALAHCFPAHEIQGQARLLFRQAYAELCDAFEQLALVRPALARKLLLVQLSHIGQRTISGALSEDMPPPIDGAQHIGRHRRRHNDDSSWCGNFADCCSCCECCDCHGCDCGHCHGCDSCCDCHGCDSCCDCNGCDCC